MTRSEKRYAHILAYRDMIIQKKEYLFGLGYTFHMRTCYGEEVYTYRKNGVLENGLCWSSELARIEYVENKVENILK